MAGGTQEAQFQPEIKILKQLRDQKISFSFLNEAASAYQEILITPARGSDKDQLRQRFFFFNPDKE
jgi:hypothetical protein